MKQRTHEFRREVPQRKFLYLLISLVLLLLLHPYLEGTRRISLSFFAAVIPNRCVCSQ